jgi:hypothetical protein
MRNVHGSLRYQQRYIKTQMCRSRYIVCPQYTFALNTFPFRAIEVFQALVTTLALHASIYFRITASRLSLVKKDTEFSSFPLQHLYVVFSILASEFELTCFSIAPLSTLLPRLMRQ